MRTLAILPSLLLAGLALATPSRASAQAVPPGVKPTPVQGDPGIFTMWRMLEDSSYSVARDYAEPGATRRMHNHPEFSYHVLVVVTGNLRLTVKGGAPKELGAGEVVTIPAGAEHTFTNVGKETATIVEVFGKGATPPK